MTELQKLGV